MLPDLDEKCGRYFRYRDFIECGQTWQREKPVNVPQELATYRALELLADAVVDPIADQFGVPKLTYGVATPALYRRIKRGISPKIDQHAGHELDQAGAVICDRGGVAVDLFVDGLDSRVLADWIVRETNFDRVYFYGDERPLHVSASESPARKCTIVERAATGAARPSTYTAERFVETLSESAR